MKSVAIIFIALVIISLNSVAHEMSMQQTSLTKQFASFDFDFQDGSCEFTMTFVHDENQVNLKVPTVAECLADTYATFSFNPNDLSKISCYMGELYNGRDIQWCGDFKESAETPVGLKSYFDSLRQLRLELSLFNERVSSESYRVNTFVTNFKGKSGFLTVLNELIEHVEAKLKAHEQSLE